MRPRGEVRQALLDAAQALARERGEANWRDIAACARVGFTKARETVKDMARAGELRQVGEQRVPHSRRPMNTYAPGGNWATQTTGSLDNVMRAWSR